MNDLTHLRKLFGVLNLLEKKKYSTLVSDTVIEFARAGDVDMLKFILDEKLIAPRDNLDIAYAIMPIVAAMPGNATVKALTKSWLSAFGGARKVPMSRYLARTNEPDVVAGLLELGANPHYQYSRDGGVSRTSLGHAIGERHVQCVIAMFNNLPGAP